METKTNVSTEATIAILTAPLLAWILLEASLALALAAPLATESKSLRVAQAVLTSTSALIAPLAGLVAHAARMETVPTLLALSRAPVSMDFQVNFF